MGNRFLAASGVQLAQTNQDQFHYLLTAQILSRQHSRQGCSTTYQPEHRWGVYSVKVAHSPLTLSNLSPGILVPLLRYPLPPLHPVCARLLDPPVLAF
jgi:hypothetical protein